LPYELLSDRNLLMRQVGHLAEQVRRQRQRSDADNAFVQLQEQMSDQIVAALDGWRDLRDRAAEQLFLNVYGSPLLQAFVGLKASDAPPRRRPGDEPEEPAFIRQRTAELKARVGEGGLYEAAIRALLYVGRAHGGADERSFLAMRHSRERQGVGLRLEEFKRIVREQLFMLRLDESAALAALPAMLPDDRKARAEALAGIREVVEAVGPMGEEARARFARIEVIFTGGDDGASSEGERPARVSRLRRAS
jgi:hypothetical protein